MIAVFLMAIIMVFAPSLTMMDQHAFYIPFLSKNHYNPDLDESLDPELNESDGY